MSSVRSDSATAEDDAVESDGKTIWFNKIVCIDVKYLKDTTQKHRVALSMVDAGAAYHVATMLRSRSSEMHWILHYGAPETFAIDFGR